MPDGKPGTATVHAFVGRAVAGIARDMHGTVYKVAAPVAYAVLRVNEDGSVATLATAAKRLDGPTSVAIGTGRGDRQSRYAVNFSVTMGPCGFAGPALVKIAVDVPG